jgi:hypothetical protein
MMTLVLSVALGLLAGGPPGSGLAAAEVVAGSERVPVELVEFVSCAASGAGEEVVITGTELRSFQTTVDGQGTPHTVLHFSFQGARGVGATTGDVYRSAAVTQAQFKTSGAAEAGAPFVSTFVFDFLLVGPGPANNLAVHETFHVTVLATGEVAVSFDHVRVECR